MYLNAHDGLACMSMRMWKATNKTAIAGTVMIAKDIVGYVQPQES